MASEHCNFTGNLKIVLSQASSYADSTTPDIIAPAETLGLCTPLSVPQSVGLCLSGCPSISQHYICEWVGLSAHIFIGVSWGFFLHVGCFFTMLSSAVWCGLSVTGWHLAEPNIISDLSVVTVGCLMTFVSIYCCRWTKTSCLPDCDSVLTRLEKVHPVFVGSMTRVQSDMDRLWQLVFARAGLIQTLSCGVKGQLLWHVQVK